MTDDVLLKQIREIVRGEVRVSESKLTEKIEKVESKLTEKIEKVDSKFTKNFDEIKVTVTRLEGKIDEVKDTVEIIQEVMIKHNGFLESRVKKIEDAINIP